MDSIIKLLPDNIANQIAAGEVIQRPASVVKELVENAVDAGATEIRIIIKDAGRTLIQVIDNGKGMAPMDARMAFERHATSKIRSADDLFQLTTLGFRGEALPSIAAVSQVTLQTRMADTPQGIRLVLEGSKELSSEPVVCAVGANFQIRHLFFNVPARRKFLKGDNTEMRHILDEVRNVAAVRPSIAFVLDHNDQNLLTLPPASLRDRLLGLFGISRFGSTLIPVSAETPLISIRGYVTPASRTRKRGAQQFFFANDRYMRHPFFHRMVLEGYGNMIERGEQPEYFLYLSVDPSTIDVNISPTKTEIKFSGESDIGAILLSAVRKAVMQGNAMPGLEFTDRPEERVEIPVHHTADPAVIGEPPSANPFVEVTGKLNGTLNGTLPPPSSFTAPMPDLSGWQEYDARREQRRAAADPGRVSVTDGSFREIISHAVIKPVSEPLLSDPFAVTLYDGELCLVHMRRAQTHISFCALRKSLRNSGMVTSAPLLFPVLITLGVRETALLKEYGDELSSIGFDISPLGAGSFSVNALPAGAPAGDEEAFLLSILEECAATGRSSGEVLMDKLALRVASHRAAGSAFPATPLMAQELLRQLFLLPDHLVTADGKTIVSFLTDKELRARFKLT